jgi:hypothetical protein
LDVSGTVFKVIQIVNLFDKLRLLNITFKGLLGKFLDQISEIFNVSLISKDDYFEITNPRFNKFYITDTSVVALRKKIDKMIFLTITMLMDIAVRIYNHVKPLRAIEKDFMITRDQKLLKKLQKRGKI